MEMFDIVKYFILIIFTIFFREFSINIAQATSWSFD